jgi:homoserine O-acetyltransferase
MQKAVYKYNYTFGFESGETIPSLEITYHHTENLERELPVIWICHALTANSNPEEWWDVLVGEGKFFDTARYRIICANVIGSCYGSTGPASKDEKGEEYLLRFPKVTVRDIVSTLEILRKHLGIKKIDLLIGGSIGGFQALEWSISSAEIIESAVFIACNSQISPWGTAFNESQRMALYADNTFFKQESVEGGKKGLAAARSIALLSYRSYEGYNAGQNEESSDFLFANKACTYQVYQGKKLVDRFNAYSYYTLTKSVDSHNVGRNRGGLEKALSQVKAKSLVIGIDSDFLFPVSEQKFIASNITGAIYEEITSKFGHDGFLLENEQITTAISKHFKNFQ